jgi:hypothetical protein
VSFLKLGGAIVALATAMGIPMTASAQTKGKALVVMSSANELDLRDGKPSHTQ